MKLSVYYLSKITKKHAATVQKRISDLERDKNGKVDSDKALELIYCGHSNGINGNGEFISTPEAVRRLTIKKEQEIDLDMQIKRGDRIPREDCELALGEVVQAISGTLKAKRNQLLDDATINEIFGQLRDAGSKMQ